MTTLILVIHIIVCIALILIVLLQTGKGADMGAVFGGAGSQTLFGNTGATTFLGKLTTGAAIIFMITSLSLAYLSKSGDKSVVTDIKPPATPVQTTVPEQQAPPADNAVTVPDESIPDPEDAQPEPAQEQTDQNQPEETPVEGKQAPSEPSGN
jgi:preprotein translocase subunit SecG